VPRKLREVEEVEEEEGIPSLTELIDRMSDYESKLDNLKLYIMEVEERLIKIEGMALVVFSGGKLKHVVPPPPGESASPSKVNWEDW
jgi:hypothetical protein